MREKSLDMEKTFPDMYTQDLETESRGLIPNIQRRNRPRKNCTEPPNKIHVNKQKENI